MAVRIGELLLKEQRITAEQLQEALDQVVAAQLDLAAAVEETKHERVLRRMVTVSRFEYHQYLLYPLYLLYLLYHLYHLHLQYLHQM